MIEFTDAGGDPVRTYVLTQGTLAGNYTVECYCGCPDAFGDEDPVFPALNPAMARALAADLIAWADSVDEQETT